MQSSMRTVDTADGPMELYEAVPDGNVRGAVIVIQEAFGITDHIQDVTQRFAAAGYHAVAPALFHRSGPGKTAPYDDFSVVTPLIMKLNDETLLVDVDAALEHLRAAGFADQQIGIVGFCLGGRVTFLVSIKRGLGAGVGFYGGGIVSSPFGQPPLIGDAGSLATPWLGLFGDADTIIPVADVDALRVALESASVETEVVSYPGASHAFNRDGGPSYHEEAASDGWRRTLEFLDTHLA